MAESQLLRPLGAGERYLYSRSSLRFYHNVGVTAAYSYSSELHVSSLRDVIFAALAIVIGMQPQMSVIPVREGYFKRLPTIDLAKVCTFSQRENSIFRKDRDDELDAVLEREHNSPFLDTIPETPFWRLRVLYDSSNAAHFTAILLFNHALFDTLSGARFHQCLATALTQRSRTLESPVITIAPIDLLPPLEELYKLNASKEEIELLRQKASAPSEVPADLWSGGVVQAPMITKFTCRFVSRETSEKFRIACRKNETTITAALEILLVAMLFELVPESFTMLRCQNAVSVRPWLRPPFHSSIMGLFVNGFDSTFQRQRFTWEAAKTEKIRISEIITTSNGLKMNIHSMSFVEDFDKYHRNMLGKRRPGSFELSNIGALAPQDDNELWRIGTMIFSQSANVCGGALKVSVATGGDGRMAISFIYQQGVLEDAMVTELVEKVQLAIEDLASET